MGDEKATKGSNSFDRCFLMLSFRFGSIEVLAMPPVFVRFIGIITIHDRVCPSDRHTGERRPVLWLW